MYAISWSIAQQHNAIVLVSCRYPIFYTATTQMSTFLLLFWALCNAITYVYNMGWMGRE